MKHEDEQATIDDIPVSSREAIRPLRQRTVQPGLNMAELERLSSHRLWAAILDLPIPEGGDDVEPAAPDQRASRFASA